MFRSFLDHHQVHKELKYAMCNRIIFCCTLHISALYGPDDGQGMTETCYPNEFI